MLNGAFWRACYYGELELVKYLLEAEDMDKHANIHFDDDYPFYIACYQNRDELIRYFIFDRNIEKTDAILAWLEENPYSRVVSGLS